MIDGYIANVAAASGADSNVYSIDNEYYEIFGGQPSYASYHITAGAPIVDTLPLPRNGCRPVQGYDACINDNQLQAELKAVIAARHLPRGLAYFYPVFFPRHVETGDGSGANSISGYCGYHSNAGSPSQEIVYSNEPYEQECGSEQSPNHNLAADAAIDTLSHELNEATTDPQITFGRTGWTDASGNEMGDICGSAYGPPLGSTDASSPQTTEYNQVINGGYYYTQTEFSNYAYNRFGVGMGCQPSESSARRGSPGTSRVAHLYLNLSPNMRPADGRSRSPVWFEEWDKDGFDVPGDRISFTTYVRFGHGVCGTVTQHAARTGVAGAVTATYRASRSNVACVVVATDAIGGKSVSAVVYQGTARSIAPRVRSAVPKTIAAGRTSTFTMRFTNRMRHPLAHSQVNIDITGPFTGSPNVRASQIRLWVSRHGRRGPFVPVALSGSTVHDPAIVGVIGGELGFSFRPGSTVALTFRLKIGRSVPRRRPKPILQLQAFFDQLDVASGADSVLVQTDPHNVTVR